MVRKQAAAGDLGPPPHLKARYRLVRWLGQGSMGQVYLAHDELLDRQVAIKFLPPEKIAGRQASARFLREARTVAQLSHPNIMTLYDVGEEERWHYMVLEYIPGRDLHLELAERKSLFPLGETLSLMHSVLDALAHAHEQGVIHRDVKPHNIMVRPQGQVKVTDFGLALVQGKARLTRPGAVMGTMVYMAPEVLGGAAADARADLYAAGAVFYELLTGRPPFTARELPAALAQILSAPLTSPQSLVPTIPPTVEAIVLKLLARDPAARYASAGEVRDAVAGLKRAQVPALLPEIAAPVEEEDKTSGLMASVLLYTTSEQTMAVVEAERRRLANLLQRDVVAALNLLLSQAQAYEQSVGSNPTAHTAVSVLTTLARQALQQVRDLEANLHPTTLNSLGLEPALETLAGQSTRRHGLEVTVNAGRMRDRLPSPFELALFRVAQEALEGAAGAGASRAQMQLAQEEDQIRFSFEDDGRARPTGETLQATCRRLEQLGGVVTVTSGQPAGFTMSVVFTLAPTVDLTPREQEVLQLLARGLSNKEIAQRLTISPRTVNFHLDNIYSKLHVNSRTAAVIAAMRQGLVRRPG